jgi:hypothetical protein
VREERKVGVCFVSAVVSCLRASYTHTRKRAARSARVKKKTTTKIRPHTHCLSVCHTHIDLCLENTTRHTNTPKLCSALMFTVDRLERNLVLVESEIGS